MDDIEIKSKWSDVFNDADAIALLEKDILPAYMRKCRWFGGKARRIEKLTIDLNIPVTYDDGLAYLLVVEVQYHQTGSEHYFLPLALIESNALNHIDDTPVTVIANLKISGNKSLLIDASYDARFRNYLFYAMASNDVKSDNGNKLVFQSGTKAQLPSDLSKISSEVLKADQSNTAIIYNKAYFFKFYRKIEKEINSDLEIVRFLSERTSFENSPTYAGSIEYQMDTGSIVFGLLQEMVDNQGEAWSMTLRALHRYFERVIANKDQDIKPPEADSKPAMFIEEAPELMQEMIGPIFYQRVMKLGQRTAEMHLALASDSNDPAFAPEKMDMEYQHELFNGMKGLVNDRLKLLNEKLDDLPEKNRPLAKEILDRRDEIISCFERIRKENINGIKTRIHGDYHLGQVLFTGKDFVIIDYEGEPGFSFKERRLKKNPFKDVGGMIRSFHYAAYGKIMLYDHYREKYFDLLEPWAEQWFQYTSKFYLAAYLDTMGLELNLSKDNKTLLEVYTLEKAIYELGYELNSRPDWVVIPLQGIKFLVDQFTKNE